MAVRSPAERRQRERRIAVLLALACVLVVGGFAWLRLRPGGAPVALDPATGCPRDGGPAGYVAILIDASDPPNEVQRAYLVRAFDTLESSIPQHQEVSVFVLGAGPSSALPAPTFRACKPPTGEGASPLDRNPRRMRERWLRGFREPLERAFEAPLHAPARADSPLMELIQAAAIQAFPDSELDAPRRMIVISDFLQHTRDVSHYDAAPRFEDFRRGPAAARVRTDLTDFEIELFYLRRAGAEAIQTPAHLDFWKDYFVWCGVGAGRLRVTRVEG